MFIAPAGGYPGMMPYQMGPMMVPAWMPYQVDANGNPIDMIYPDNIYQEQGQEVLTEAVDEQHNGENN